MPHTPAEPPRLLRRLTCARCGTVFDCGNGGQAGGCWCADEDFRLPMPTPAGEDCLCPACMRAAASLRKVGRPA